MKDFYHFQLVINETLISEDDHYCFLALRSLGEFSQIGEKTYMTKALLEETSMVSVVKTSLVRPVIILYSRIESFVMQTYSYFDYHSGAHLCAKI